MTARRKRGMEGGDTHLGQLGTLPRSFPPLFSWAEQRCSSLPCSLGRPPVRLLLLFLRSFSFAASSIVVGQLPPDPSLFGLAPRDSPRCRRPNHQNPFALTPGNKCTMPMVSPGQGGLGLQFSGEPCFFESFTRKSQVGVDDKNRNIVHTSSAASVSGSGSKSLKSGRASPLRHTS